MNQRKWLSILLVVILAVASACGNQAKGDYEITGTYDPDKYVELGDYTGLSIDVSVTAEELQADLDSLLEEYQEYEEKKGKAKEGDSVNIDYEGKIDGTAFEGGTSEDYMLTLGEGAFIDGFEDQIVGRKTGEEFLVNVTFPEDYDEGLAGKAAEFTVKLNYIQGEGKFKEVDEAFLQYVKEAVTKMEEEEAAAAVESGLEPSEPQDMAKYESLEKYKAFLTEEIKEAKKDSELADLFTGVVEAAKVDEYPPNVMESIRTRTTKAYQKSIEQQFGGMDQYLQMAGQTQEDYDAFLEQSITGYTKELLVSEAIAKKEKIEVPEEEMKEMIDMYVEDHQKADEKELAAYFQEEYGTNLRDLVHEMVLTEKIKEYFIAHVEIKE